MASFAHNLPDTISEAELLDLVGELNADERVDGILVQLPLPAQIDATRVIATIDPAKDVDGFHPLNAGRLAAGLDGAGALHAARLPASAQGASSADLAGLDAVVIGRSNIVGKPMAMLLLRRKRDRDHRPFEDPRPARRRAPRRHRRRRRRPAGNGPRRLDQARRDGDRRRHQPHPDRRRQGPAGRRRRFRRGGRGRRRDHAGARAASGR